MPEALTEIRAVEREITGWCGTGGTARTITARCPDGKRRVMRKCGELRTVMTGRVNYSWKAPQGEAVFSRTLTEAEWSALMKGETVP